MSNRTNYKLRWTLDEISVFVQQSRQHIVRNKHDGLIFVLSAYDDRSKVFYDSNG